MNAHTHLGTARRSVQSMIESRPAQNSGRFNSPRTPQLVAFCLATAAFLAIVMGLILGRSTVDVWGAFVIPALLLIIMIPIIRVIERQQSTDLSRLLVIGLIARFIATYYRFLMEANYYGYGDAMTYFSIGHVRVDQLLTGAIPLGDFVPTGSSTTFIQNLTGPIELITGQSSAGTFAVYSLFGFIGIWGFIGAARRAIPEINLRRYALLVLFLPTMLFWSSAIGKDAWMTMCLGILAAGASRIFTRTRGGIVLTGIGMIGVVVCRPHIGVIAAAALLVTIVVARPRRATQTSASPSGPLRIGLIVIAIVALAFSLGAITSVFPKAQPFSDPASLSAISIDTASQTARGNSQIEATSANQIWLYPVAFASAVFRPLIFEARTPPSLIAAIEGTVLIALVVRWRKNVFAGLRLLRSSPYLLFATLDGVMFFIIFASISNLGILARQRVQGLPFILLLLAIETVAERNQLVDSSDDHGDNSQNSGPTVPPGPHESSEASDSR